MANKAKTLTWGDRLALINHYNPSDEVICSAFGVTQGELDTARNMLTSGSLAVTPDIDFASYSSIFASSDNATATTKPSSKTTSTTSTVKAAEGEKAPETATKRVKAPQKRGRKGDKIAIAFAKIPETPTKAEAFATEYSVSLAVLRQSKRFDKSPELGNVRVKKDKDTGELMIWRESTTASA